MFKLVLLFSIAKPNFSQTIAEFSNVSSQSPIQVRMQLHIFVLASLSLCNAVSLTSRFNINKDQLNELDKDWKIFFTSCPLFLEVKPTVWTIGNVVPVHKKGYTAEVWKRFAHEFYGGEGGQAVSIHMIKILKALRLVISVHRNRNPKGISQLREIFFNSLDKHG